MNLNPAAERRATYGVLALSLITFLAMSWLQYFSFAVPAVDFSIFDQMLPNTAQGRFMVSAACGNCDHFGVHSTPILFLLLPFHLLFHHPLFMVTVHALVLWSAAFPLLALCRRRLPDPKDGALRLGVLVAFFCSPFLIKILDYQFHPEVFYVPLFLMFACMLDSKTEGQAASRAGWPLVLICLLILSVKEDGAVYLAAALTGAAATRKLRWQPAVLLILSCIGVFYLNTRWVIPANSGLGEYRLAGTASRFGNSMSELVVGIFQHWKEVLGEVLKGAWLRNLFRFLFLPLLSPCFLIAVSPFVLVHSVADSPVMRGLATYYSAPYLPWTFVGWIWVLADRRFLESRWARGMSLPGKKRFREFAVVFAVLTSVPAWYPRHYPRLSTVRALNSDFSRLAERIGEGESICAQTSVFPHLGYGQGLKLLDPTCREKSVRRIIFNPGLGMWPYSTEEFQSMMSRLERDSAYERANYGSFVLFSRKGH